MSENKLFDVSEFKVGNCPDNVIGTFEPDSLSDDIVVEDMPIKFPRSKVLIPDFITADYQRLIQRIFEYDTNNDDLYTYLTITTSTVESDAVQRIPGWHVDGFQKPHRGLLSVQRQYAVTNCLPTLFCTDPLDVVHSGTKKEFFKQLTEKCQNGTSFWQAAPYQIHLLNSFCPHRPVKATETIRRFFVRVSFSPVPFTRKNNTINPLFKYKWDSSTKKMFYNQS